MGRILVNPPGVVTPRTYSHASIATGDTLVFFSGQVAVDENRSIIGEGDLRVQAEAAMRNLKTVMDSVGVTWEDIVQRTVYTVVPDGYHVIAEAMHRATGGAGFPAQTTLTVAGLALPELLVEIEAVGSISREQ